MKAIDLFCGCGGMTLGFKWAGFKSVIASDIDINCGKTINRNFPDTTFLLGDISELGRVTFDKILKDQHIDVITGGPPCQGFSLANKNRNKIEDDPRNKLFYDYVKVIRWYNPKAFVMELIGKIHTFSNGKQEIRNSVGKRLGSYNPNTNETRDYTGSLVGKGNLLTMLL